jgi:hypothetical protein
MLVWSCRIVLPPSAGELVRTGLLRADGVLGGPATLNMTMGVRAAKSSSLPTSSKPTWCAASTGQRSDRLPRIRQQTNLS